MNGSRGAITPSAGLVAAVLVGVLGATLLDAASSDARARNGLIAYSQETDRCGSDECESYVWTVGPNGKGRHRLECSTDFGGCGDELPVFSPGGRRLATAANEIDFTQDAIPKDILAVRDVDGRVRKTIPHTRGGITALAWSGDGTRLAFADSRGIFVLGRDGTGQRRFRKTRAGDLAWSRQGRLAWTPEFSGRIAVTNEARTRVSRLAVGGTSLAWAPDGRRLAYYASDGEVVKIIRVGAGRRTGRPRTVTRRCTGEVGINVDTDIAWSPDGRQLLCTTFDRHLIAVNVRTGRTRVVAGGPNRFSIRSFDWQRAPRGR